VLLLILFLFLLALALPAVPPGIVNDGNNTDMIGNANKVLLAVHMLC